MTQQSATPVPATRRPWYRFGLRAMFIAITLAIVLGYTTLCHVRWLNSRQEFLATSAIGYKETPRLRDGNQWGLGPARTAPGLLSLFGESGQITLIIQVDEDSSDDLSPRGLKEVQQVKDLFPEADLMVFRKTGAPVWFMARAGK